MECGRAEVAQRLAAPRLMTAAALLVKQRHKQARPHPALARKQARSEAASACQSVHKEDWATLEFDTSNVPRKAWPMSSTTRTSRGLTIGQKCSCELRQQGIVRDQPQARQDCIHCSNEESSLFAPPLSCARNRGRNTGNFIPGECRRYAWRPTFLL